MGYGSLVTGYGLRASVVGNVLWSETSLLYTMPSWGRTGNDSFFMDSAGFGWNLGGIWVGLGCVCVCKTFYKPTGVPPGTPMNPWEPIGTP